MIYLDYSAHTPSDSRVIECFCKYEKDFIGNANSAHLAGREANQEIKRVSQSVADLLNVDSDEIIYTSGASESNNLAINGIARASRHIGKHIISTPLEHSSVSGCLTHYRSRAMRLTLST